MGAEKLPLDEIGIPIARSTHLSFGLGISEGDLPYQIAIVQLHRFTEKLRFH